MKNPQRYATVVLALLTSTITQAADPVLEYHKPADDWVQAMPIGNGRLGAMVFGRTAEEKIQFNEDTLWAGHPRDYAHGGAADYLGRLRQLLYEGKQKQAEQLAMKHFMSVPLGQFPYQAFGDLNLHFPGHNTPGDYRRQLDLDSAKVTVTYKIGEVTYTREIFASFCDQLIAIRLTADKPGAITCDATLSTPHPHRTSSIGGGTPELWIEGHVAPFNNNRVQSAPDAPTLEYAARLIAKLRGGSLKNSQDSISIVNADQVCLYLIAATSYNNYHDITADPGARCNQATATLRDRDFDTLLRRHTADYRKLYRRVRLDLGTTDRAKLPIDQRIAKFLDADDPHLAMLYFQFGRYLLISSSRPGSQPANLQGIWNDSLAPPWDSKYTTNINTEMNYWLAETTNLSECHEPLFRAIEDLVVSGRRTGRIHYDCPGWVLHHNFDIWRGTAPINHSNHGIWPTGGAWLCQHLWWRFQYTQDKEFLRRRAYPIMKQAALFFAEYLTEDPRTEERYLISGPSNSPEIGGLAMGPTMDHQIIRSLFGWVIESAEILEADENLRDRLAELRKRIAPNRIGRHGQLQEWLEDKDDPENHHRHLSHVWGLYPGNEITPERAPELAAAARRSLDFRGDGSVGWSRAWQVNLYARLRDSETAYNRLASLIARNANPNLFNKCWDNRPTPFQIDGNLGGAAGIAEMLVQSHSDAIRLLPALPDAWPTGYVKGLCARGGFEVDITWKSGQLTEALIRSKSGNPCRVVYGTRTIRFDTQAGEIYQFNDELKESPQTTAGFYDPEKQQIEGWTVSVDPRLLVPNEANKRAMGALVNHLQRVNYIMPASSLERMHKMHIWIEQDNPALAKIKREHMQYHPGRGWLVKNGLDPRLVKHVHIPKAANMLEPHTWAKHPYVVLHELSHAYHDHYFGYDDPRILSVYDQAMEKHLYDKALLYTGRHVRHYGATNQMEYFAEATEAYFGVNDFYPFVRAELKEHDPEGYALMESIWGKIR